MRCYILPLWSVFLPGPFSVSETDHIPSMECCCCSVTQSRLTLCDPVDCSTPGFPVLLYLPEFAQTYELRSVDSVMPSSHLILCRPLLLPSIFPSIRVFSNELALCIRWPKYWSLSISISSVAQFCSTLWDPMDCSMPGSSVLHCLLEFTHIHVH